MPSFSIPNAPLRSLGKEINGPLPSFPKDGYHKPHCQSSGHRPRWLDHSGGSNVLYYMENIVLTSKFFWAYKQQPSPGSYTWQTGWRVNKVQVRCLWVKYLAVILSGKTQVILSAITDRVQAYPCPINEAVANLRPPRGIGVLLFHLVWFLRPLIQLNQEEGLLVHKGEWSLWISLWSKYNLWEF